MDRAGALTLGLLCSCPPSGQAECLDAQQDAQRESSIPAKDTSAQVKEVSDSQLKDWMANGQKMILIDVREDNEWAEGHAAIAIHIPRWTLSEKIERVAPDKSIHIVLYCLPGGVRSAAAAASIQKMGYTRLLPIWRV